MAISPASSAASSAALSIPSACQRFRDRRQLRREGDGGDQQGALGVGGKRLGAPGERSLERRTRGDGLGQRLSPAELLGVEQALHLEQGQRVPLRRLPQPLDDLGGDGRSVTAGEQLHRLVRREPTELETVDSGRCEASALTLANGEEDRHGVRVEPLRGEQKGVRRRAVEPLRIVDDHEKRARFGRRSEKAQGRRADREAVVHLGLAQAQSATQRLRLLRWDLRKVLEKRAEQLEKARELQLGLRLDAESAHHGHPVGSLHGMPEQGCLADPRLSADDECVTVAAPGLLEQLVDPGALALPADQHGRNRSQASRPRQRDRHHTSPIFTWASSWLSSDSVPSISGCDEPVDSLDAGRGARLPCGHARTVARVTPAGGSTVTSRSSARRLTRPRSSAQPSRRLRMNRSPCPPWRHGHHARSGCSSSMPRPSSPRRLRPASLACRARRRGSRGTAPVLAVSNACTRSLAVRMP